MGRTDPHHRHLSGVPVREERIDDWLEFVGLLCWAAGPEIPDPAALPGLVEQALPAFC